MGNGGAVDVVKCAAFQDLIVKIGEGVAQDIERDAARGKLLSQTGHEGKHQN